MLHRRVKWAESPIPALRRHLQRQTAAMAAPRSSHSVVAHPPSTFTANICRVRFTLPVASVTRSEPVRNWLSTATSTAINGKNGGDKRSTNDDNDQFPFEDGRVEEEEEGEVWEDEEDEAEPEEGDGGNGGGIVLGDVSWGKKALAIANEVLCSHFDSDIKLFAFKVSPNGYIYIRLDKTPHKYGCPEIEEIEHFNLLYKERLEECEKQGDVPENLAIEVSSPGATRLLKIPDDLVRFKEIPMVIHFLEKDVDSNSLQHREGVFFLDSIDSGGGISVWKLADVRENRDPQRKGRPLSKKQRDWRLSLPFGMIKRATFYLSF